MQFTLDFSEASAFVSDNAPLVIVAGVCLWYFVAGLVIRRKYGTAGNDRISSDDTEMACLCWIGSPLVFMAVFVLWPLVSLISAGFVDFPPLWRYLTEKAKQVKAEQHG